MLFIGLIFLLLVAFNISFVQDGMHYSFNIDFLLYQNNSTIYFRHSRSLGYILSFLGILDLLIALEKRVMGSGLEISV